MSRLLLLQREPIRVPDPECQANLQQLVVRSFPDSTEATKEA
jgi:hypothetical protein